MISNLNFSIKRLHRMITEEWCTIGIHRGPLTQITSFAGYIYLSCFSQWSLSHLGMSTVSPRSKKKNYLENGLGPLWFVQQCTLKSLRPNPAMPQPCILHILTFVFEIVGHWLYTIFLCCLDGEGRNIMIHTAISLMGLDVTSERKDWRNYERDQVLFYKVRLMKRRIEEIMRETNNKGLQGLFDLWSVAHLAQTDLEEWTLSVKHHS